MLPICESRIDGRDQSSCRRPRDCRKRSKRRLRNRLARRRARARRRWRLNDERSARFVNPGRPISAETMAVHHILDCQVAGAPLWKQIAATILQPTGGVLALAAHRAAFEQRYCTPRLCGGAPWICTWKCALRVWPELPRFSNQMLRYQRMPEGLVHEIGLPAHRAMPDAWSRRLSL